MLLQAIKENEAIQEIGSGFTDLVTDLKELLYIGDNLTSAITNTKQAFEDTKKAFELLKRK